LVLQAYIDDSEGTDGSYVLAGHIASVEQWATFSREWGRLLPWAKLGRNNVRRYKFNEMMGNPQDRERSAAFYRVIEDNVLLSISYCLNRHDIRRARNRIYSPNGLISWEGLGNDYLVAFRGLLDSFNANRHQLGAALLTEPVDFIFDEQREKGMIFALWDDYMQKRSPEDRALYGTTPRFESDEKFLPLQAADLWAGMNRAWRQQGEVSERIADLDFGAWQSKKRDTHGRMAIELSEDDIVENLLRAARSSVAFEGVMVFDIKWLLPRIIVGYGR
jgi:hypothetical protein